MELTPAQKRDLLKLYKYQMHGGLTGMGCRTGRFLRKKGLVCDSLYLPDSNWTLYRLTPEGAKKAEELLQPPAPVPGDDLLRATVAPTAE